ncbi:MAG: precorrin-3B C(17)-methyltransferase [Lachnospiraceae bacterium]|nr:precorrin-3B C(17)-methyltransferase [Lachnospiraceae bacterium]
MGKIYVIGIGPGDENMMTVQAKEALNECDIIIGYSTYIELIKDRYKDKKLISNGMRMEVERCKECLELAMEGHKVALICSGDPGVYGMASPMLEIAGAENFEDIEIIPGISAALSGAAILGAPLNHDFCVISLSDLLTPREIIEKRLVCAAKGDFCIAIYNPASHKRKDYLKWACEILMTVLSKDVCCGYVRNIGREGGSVEVCTLGELRYKEVDMFVTVFIGNTNTRIENGKLITPRGYKIQ